MAQLVSLAQAQVLRQTRLAEQASDSVGRLWDRVDGIDDAAQAAYSRQAARAMGSVRLASVRATQGFLATVERQAAGAATALGDPAAVLAQVRGGIPLEEVYGRPFVTARTAISQGKSYLEARAAGKARAQTIADTDVILSQNVAARDYMTRSSRIVGHRRVPDAGACDYCLMAATQRYKVADLQPIHPRCHCGVIPIIGSKDPGQVVDKETLDRLKADARPKVESHSELGPVLITA
jgi:hypothetical protein